MAVMVLLAVACCAVYKAVIGAIPIPFSWVIFGGAVLLYGVLAMGYAIVLSAVFGVRAAAARGEDFLYELFESLKDKVRSKIDNMEEGISKQQAKVILDNSVREVFSPLKKFRFESAPKAAAAKPNQEAHGKPHNSCDTKHKDGIPLDGQQYHSLFVRLCQQSYVNRGFIFEFALVGRIGVVAFVRLRTFIFYI